MSQFEGTAESMADIPRKANGFLVKAEIRQSPGKGLGVFAAEFIPANEKIYSSNPLTYTEEETLAYLESLPTNEEKTQWLRYAYGSNGKVCFDSDDLKMINHSENPTIKIIDGKPIYYGVAARDIEENEELTENYRTYSPTPAYDNMCKKYGLVEIYEKDSCVHH